MADEMNEAPDKMKDKLQSKRFALPAMGMTGVYLLVVETEHVIIGAGIIAVIAIAGLAAEFYLKLKGMWNGHKEK